MKFKSVIIVILAVAMAVALSGCQSPDNEHLVAEVGGHPITSDQLADYYLGQQILEKLITETLVISECNKRGIQLDAERYEESINGFIAQQGGKENAEKGMRENHISWSSVFYFNRMQVLTSQLMDDEIGLPTEEEIDKLWDENKDRYIQLLTNSLNISKPDVTKESARDEIINEWKGMRSQELQATFFVDLKKTYDVKNYITGEGLELEGDDLALLDLTDTADEEEGEEESGEEGDEEQEGSH